MRIHCPECEYEGGQGIWNAISTLLARAFSQTNVTCPRCGFQRAFSLSDWRKVRN